MTGQAFRPVVRFACAALVIVAATADVAHSHSETTPLRFERDIRPLLERACVGCHAAGGAAPMPLRTYEEVRPWATAIKESVLARRMPPWAAVNGFGLFRNAPPLTARDVERIVSWVEGGGPRGTTLVPEHGDEDVSPAAPAERVRLRRVVAAARTSAALEVLLPNDRTFWLRGIHWQPPGGVQGASFFLRVPGRAGRAGSERWIGSWTSAHHGVELPVDTGVRVEPRATLVAKLDVVGDVPGLAETTVGLVWTAARPRFEVEAVSIPLTRATGQQSGSMQVKEPKWIVGMHVGGDRWPAALHVMVRSPRDAPRLLLRTAEGRGLAPRGFYPKTPVLAAAGTEIHAWTPNDVDEVSLLVVDREQTPDVPLWPATSPASQAWAVPEDAGFTCPMHAQVHREGAGACHLCGMDLVPVAAIGQDFDLELRTGRVMAGQPGELVFVVRDPLAGAVVSRFHELHERLLHVFIVSDDQAYFDHLHPEAQPGGRFTVTTTLPRPGLYKVFVDFHPEGGAPQLLQSHVLTAEVEAAVPGVAPPALTPSTTVGGVSPATAAFGKAFTLTHTLTAAEVGDLDDLAPYLGALAHIVIVSEDLEECIHAHPSEASFAIARTPAGLRLSSRIVLPREGRYRVWMQFLRRGEVVTTVHTIRATGWGENAQASTADNLTAPF